MSVKDLKRQQSVQSSPSVGSTTSRYAHLSRLSRFMDSGIRLPGGFRIGWDGIIGLVPGIGDLVGTGVSAWIVLGAARAGAPKRLIARMLLNVGLETLVGFVPLLGDVFDFVFKANDRNMRLLDRHVIDPAASTRHSTRWLLGLVVLLLAGMLLLGWAMLAILHELWVMIV